MRHIFRMSSNFPDIEQNWDFSSIAHITTLHEALSHLPFPNHWREDWKACTFISWCLVEKCVVCCCLPCQQKLGAVVDMMFQKEGVISCRAFCLQISYPRILSPTPHTEIFGPFCAISSFFARSRSLPLMYVAPPAALPISSRSR